MKNSAQLVKEWLKGKAVWFSHSHPLCLFLSPSARLICRAWLWFAPLSFSLCFAFPLLFSLSVLASASLVHSLSLPCMVKSPCLLNGNGLWLCHGSNSASVGHWAALCGQHLPSVWLRLQTFCSPRPRDPEQWNMFLTRGSERFGLARPSCGFCSN